MDSYFVVETSQGKNWILNVDMRSQKLWKEHANFMNNLEETGLVVLGGPIDPFIKNSHTHTALLIVDGPDEATISKKLLEDPWMKEQILQINHIRKWDILLNRQSPVR